jgi:hypothetical protein
MRSFSRWAGVVAIFISSSSCFSQGTIFVSNRDIPKADGSGTYDAPIYLSNGAGPGFAGENWRGPWAGLFWLRPDGSVRGMVSTVFGEDADSPYFVPMSMPFSNAELAPGKTGLFVIRVWSQPMSDKPDFVYGDYFQSRPFWSLPLGAADGAGAPGLTGLQSFTEPPPGPDVPDPLNSKFELYMKSPRAWTVPGSADLAIDNTGQDLPFWEILGHVDYIKAGPQQTPGSLDPGNFAIDLATSAGPGGIGRRLDDRTPNFKYRLNFYYSGNPDPAFANEPSNKRFKVIIGPVTYDFSYDIAVEQNSFANMKWKRGSIPFTGAAHRIKFICETPGIQAGPVIDSVTIDRAGPPETPISLTYTGVPGELSWNTVPLFYYSVQASVDLGNPGLWYHLGSFYATNSTLQFRDPDVARRPFAIYRVVLP